MAAELSWPLFEKDAIKETLFDELGIGDRAWSARLGRATMALQFQTLEVELRAGRSVVVEAPFKPDLANPEFERLAQRSAFAPVQVYCDADPDVLVQRFAERAGKRHPGHVDEDADARAEVERAVREGHYAPIALSGPFVRFAVGDDPRAVVDAVKASLSQPDLQRLQPG